MALVITASVLVSVLVIAGIAATGARAGVAAWTYMTEFAIWSAARLAVLLVLARSADVPRPAAMAAWAVSLPVLSIGSLPSLGIPAFVLSAFTAYRVLIARGTPPARAFRIVAWAYGGHAVGAGISTAAAAVLAG